MMDGGPDRSVVVRRHSAFLFGVLALVCPSTVCAQDPGRSLSQSSERFYKTEQGLPQDEIRSIAQTRDGYLWFGTRDGLARFDGVRFTVFREETTPGIGHNMFGALLVDHLGRLWIATGDGLSCYEHGQFRRYTVREGLPSNAIHSLLEDRSGTLWIGTWNGLAAFDGLRFRIFTSKDGLPQNSISGLAEDGSGGLWIGTFGGGLVQMTGNRFRVLTQKDGLPSDMIFTVVRDRTGRVWIGTLRGCAVLIAKGRFEKVRELSGRTIYLFEDRSGSMWAAADKVFARKRPGSGSVFQLEDGPNLDVETVFEDREGSLWVGTLFGLARYRAGPFISYTTHEGLAGNNAITIFEDSKGVLWVGTETGLCRKSRGVMETLPRQSLRGDGLVNSITEDADGRIWIGTLEGISRFDGRVWTQLGVREHIPSGVHVLLRDRAGRIWIGSPEGVTVWDHGLVSTIGRRDGLPNKYVTSILEDHEGRMWIGTATGLAWLDHGKLSAYSKTDGLLSDYIQCLYEDSDGTLWICTPSGLHRFKNGRFHSFTEKDGMFSDSTLQLLEDDQRRFWISTYRGVFRVDRDQLNALADGARARVESVSYGTEAGMKSSVFNGLGRQPAGWKARDGILWFPTDQGVVSIDPAHLSPPNPPPTPVLEAILTDGTSATTTTMGPDVRRIEFAVTAPSSVSPESIEFRYRMQGYEDQWREAGTQRLVSFTNLPGGSYRFAVSARRKGGPWSTQEVASTLRVLPHFYETSWFYVGSGLMALLLLWLAHSYRLRQTELRLNSVMAERSRVAQELHDTLLQSLSGTAMQIQAALRRLRQGAVDSGFEQLSAALLHMGKSMADARQAIWDLKTPELQELRLDHALEAAGERVCSGGPRFKYAVSGNPKRLDSCLERHIYRIGVEAITNAVRHSRCKEISVELDYSDELIRLRVRDDGSGFHIPEAGSSSLANHWGLTGIRDRASQCSGRLCIESAPGFGTDLQFEAPFLEPDRERVKY